MKTIKKMIVFVIMLTIATGYAAENNVYVPNRVTTVLKFSNVKKGHEYTIKNSQGIIIFSEILEREGTYVKKFDFTGLEDGRYTFEISKDFEITITPFKILSKRVMFLNNQTTKTFKPVVRLKKDVLMISQLNLSTTPMEFKLYYNDELIHSDTLNEGHVLGRLLKLSKNQKGTYDLIMKSGNQNFRQTFEL